MAWEDIKNKIYTIGSQLRRMEPVSPIPRSQMIPQRFQNQFEQASQLPQRATALPRLPVKDWEQTFPRPQSPGNRMRERWQRITNPREPRAYTQEEPMATTQPMPLPTTEPTQQPRPTPTMVPGTEKNEYFQVIQKYFPKEEWNRASNVAFGESSFRPNIVHVNTAGGGSSVEVKTREQFDDLMRKYDSIDIGLFQLNSKMLEQSKALEQLGITWYDLFNPEKNAEVAAKWVAGQIKGLLPGWQNWATKYAEE